MLKTMKRTKRYHCTEPKQCPELQSDLQALHVAIELRSGNQRSGPELERIRRGQRPRPARRVSRDGHIGETVVRGASRTMKTTMQQRDGERRKKMEEEERRGGGVVKKKR